MRSGGCQDLSVLTLKLPVTTSAVDLFLAYIQTYQVDLCWELMCLFREEARRNRWQWGQCTLVLEPGLPTSGRDMWEDWLVVWREDLRILEEEVEAEEVEEVWVAATADLETV